VEPFRARKRNALAPSPNKPPNSPATRPGWKVRLWTSEVMTAMVQSTAVFASEKFGVQLRGERRIAAMRFAGDDDPIELSRATSRSMKRLLRGARTEREFILFFVGVSQRFNSGAKAKFTRGHAEGSIDFFGRNSA
jgi:hypothetical protein